jgi:hypothetical protein
MSLHWKANFTQKYAPARKKPKAIVSLIDPVAKTDIVTTLAAKKHRIAAKTNIRYRPNFTFGLFIFYSPYNDLILI